MHTGTELPELRLCIYNTFVSLIVLRLRIRPRISVPFNHNRKVFSHISNPSKNPLWCDINNYTRIVIFYVPTAQLSSHVQKVVAITLVNFNCEHFITLLGFEFLAKTFIGAGYIRPMPMTQLAAANCAHWTLDHMPPGRTCCHGLAGLN